MRFSVLTHKSQCDTRIYAAILALLVGCFSICTRCREAAPNELQKLAFLQHLNIDENCPPKRKKKCTQKKYKIESITSEVMVTKRPLEEKEED